MALILFLLSLARTQLETQVAVGQWSWSSLAPIDLVNAEIVAKPTDWVGRDTAERRFRITWCRDRQIPADACEPPTERYHTTARETWCAARPIEDCAAEFQRLDAAFTEEWQEQRSEYLANLTKPDLSGRDLRGANAAGAFLAGIDLSEARLEGTNFAGARLENSDLVRARLEGADLSQARLEGADLWQAQLQDSDLGGARLEVANLTGARLEGSNLTGAQLDGANLNGAQLQVAVWAGATFGASTAHGADFTGGRYLTQRQLAKVIGNQNTILPLDSETEEQLHVWSCRPGPPATFDGLLHRWPEEWHDLISRGWLCPPGVAPERTGRPAGPEPAAPLAD